MQNWRPIPSPAGADVAREVSPVHPNGLRQPDACGVLVGEAARPARAWWPRSPSQAPRPRSEIQEHSDAEREAPVPAPRQLTDRPPGRTSSDIQQRPISPATTPVGRGVPAPALSHRRSPASPGASRARAAAASPRRPPSAACTARCRGQQRALPHVARLGLREQVRGLGADSRGPTAVPRPPRTCRAPVEAATGRSQLQDNSPTVTTKGELTATTTASSATDAG